MKKFSQNFYKSFSIIEIFKKKKKRKNFISINPPSSFSTSLFSFHIEPITSCQRLIDTTTPSREQESALLPFFFTIYTTQSFRDLSRALFYSNHASINLGRELGGCLLSLLSLVVPRNLGRREESWGRTIEEKLYSGLFGEGNSFSFPGYRE